MHRIERMRDILVGKQLIDPQSSQVYHRFYFIEGKNPALVELKPSHYVRIASQALR